MKKLFLAILILSVQLTFAQSTGTPVANKPSGGTLTGSSSLFNVAQTTAGQTITIPNPTGTIYQVQVNNTGSSSFTLLSKTIEPGTGIILRWTGAAWNISGLGNATAGGGGGTGDIEGVTAGFGLTGGGTTGTIQLGVDTSNITTAYDNSLKVDKSGAKVLSDENYSTAEKSKLAGIATGATANSTDAQLRDRTTHTGAQAISTVTGLQAALDAKEPVITSGSTSTWWRGDKSFQALTKTDVGLSNATNTSDANKPVSTAQQTALDLKQNLPVTETMVDANKTVTSGKTGVLVSAALSAPRTLTLLAASLYPAGAEFSLIDIVGGVNSTNYVTVVAAGSDLINGSANLLFNSQYGVSKFISDGVSKWNTNQLVSYSEGTWVPTFSGFSTNPTSVFASYVKIGRSCTVTLTCLSGISNLALTSVTLPFTGGGGGNGAPATSDRAYVPLFVMNNNVQSTSTGMIIYGQNILYLKATGGSTDSFTASGNKGVWFTFTYLTIN